MTSTGGSVSNVCYADIDYIRSRLLLRTDLAYWAVIDHPAYMTPTGEARKRHCHIYIEAGPARVNLAALSKDLEQITPGTDAPLGVMEWRKSQYQDWLPYAVHDSQYMAYKRLKKAYYDLPIESVLSSDPDRVRAVWSLLPRSTWESAIERLLRAQSDGLTFVEFAAQERLPFAQIGPALRVWESVMNDLSRVAAASAAEQDDGEQHAGA